MSQQGEFWQAVDKRSKKVNPSPVQVGQVVSLEPFAIKYNGVDLGKEYGDTIYVNNLILDEVISFETANPIVCSEGNITENHTGIINAITAWLVSVHDRFILHTGDYVAVQKLGNNTYIVLEKVIKK